jgi:hypothetical protein
MRTKLEKGLLNNPSPLRGRLGGGARPLKKHKRPLNNLERVYEEARNTGRVH